MINTKTQPLSNLTNEFNWFQQVLKTRMDHYFQHKDKTSAPIKKSPPQLQVGTCYYTQLVNHYQLTPEERLVLMLALAPDIKPELLDVFFTLNSNIERGFSEFGGIVGRRHSGFIPTIETAFFLLSGGDISLRLRYTHFFENKHVFFSNKILDLDANDQREPTAGTPLRLNQDVLDMLILGAIRDPDSGADFPAKRLNTELQWEDVVFAPQTEEQLKELRAWLKHETTFYDDWQFRKYMKPGYKCLFYGPPGTGKTLTASLLGKLSNRSVYRIDLSQLVSKYIGETEKNLEKIFTQAERRNWILFFDEADSIFGKRTTVSDAHDRHANQGTAYLLQRIEDCPNVVILASNYKTNIDEAFFRRFQSTVYFPVPRKHERLRLWQQGFSPVSTLEAPIQLEMIAEEYKMAGGAIMNAIRYCSLMAIARNTRIIAYNDLIQGIQREFNKEGRTI
jgi:AAA+ superfamily predicted ATPase